MNKDKYPSRLLYLADEDISPLHDVSVESSGDNYTLRDDDGEELFRFSRNN